MVKVNEEILVLSRLLGATEADALKFDAYPFTEYTFKTYTKQYKFILWFKEKYGKYPDRAAFRKKFPEFKIIKTRESVAYYCDLLSERENLFRLKRVAEKIQPLINEGKASEAINALTDQLSSIQVSVEARGLDFGKVKKDHYNKTVIQKAKDLRSGKLFDTPYTNLNNLIVGMRSENLVTLSGRPSMGKTWILCLFALHYFHKGFRVLLVSKEQSEDEFQERLDALEARLDWMRFRNGMLIDVQKKRFAQVLSARSKCKGKLFIVGDTSLKGDSPEVLASDISRYLPDVVLVDGMQQFEIPGAKDEVHKMMYLSRLMKRIAKSRKVLIIQTIHQRRESEGKKNVGSGGLGGIAWSDAPARDSDIVLELYAGEDGGDGRESPFRKLKIIKGRDVGYGEFTINFKFKPKLDFGEVMTSAPRWRDEKRLREIIGRVK